jgi:membrane protein implicated in regulation of membrane protease activity
MQIQTTFDPVNQNSVAPAGEVVGRGLPSKRRTEVPSTLFFALIPSLLVVIWVVLLATGYSLDLQTKFFDVIVKIVTISATIIGAIWSYYAFFRQRLKEPRLNVTHEINPLDLPDGKRLLKVYATITNIGQVRVELCVWRLRAEQVLPLTKTALADLAKGAFTDAHGHSHWNCLVEGTFSKDDKSFEMALEPGETDRASANLIIIGEVKAVQVYSHFSRTSDARPLVGWPSRTLIDLREDQTTKGETHDRAGNHPAG